jgi:hypothetical protein
MDWNEKLKEREVIESCRRSHYEDYEYDDEEEVDEDELHDGDDWEYWTNRMKEDLAKDGSAK